MTTKTIVTIVLIAIAFLNSYTAKAQKGNCRLELNYTTEFQNNFRGQSNWVNLLACNGEYTPWKNGKLSLQTLSIYKTRKERITDDLQTFSNIEENNMAITIFLAGYTHSKDQLTLFGGIRNINNDYFTDEYTSLFTNSSCGIYPTLSSNFPIANYPLSAMCLHGEFGLSQTCTMKSSLYNGTAHKLSLKEGSLFAIRPHKDGIVCITEFSYSSKSNYHGIYHIGGVLHTDCPIYSNNTQEEEKKKVNSAFWGSIEQSIYQSAKKDIGLLWQASLAPTEKNTCYRYYGLGTVLTNIIPIHKTNQLGIVVNKAVFHEISETVIELTGKYEVNTCLTIQPAFHFIKTGKKKNTIGMIRINYRMNKR